MTTGTIIRCRQHLPTVALVDQGALLSGPSATAGSVKNCGEVGISPSELNPGPWGSGR
jgi:hypothetical protein